MVSLTMVSSSTTREMLIGVAAMLVSERALNAGFVPAENRKHARCMVKTVAGRDRSQACSRVEGTLQRSGARAFKIDVSRELGKGNAFLAKERCCSLENLTGRCVVNSSLSFVVGVEEIRQFRLETAIDTRKETRARY